MLIFIYSSVLKLVNDAMVEIKMPEILALEILGCSGSLGAPENGTSCLLLGDCTLIDAGSGMTKLATPALSRINHVFLSHSHLDHICALPFLIETRQHFQSEPLKVYGHAETINAVRTHLFNDVIWPDFTIIPSVNNPAVEFIEIDASCPLIMSNFTITPIEMNHSVPTLGFAIRSINSVLVITSDTYLNDALASSLSEFERIDHLIIESSFSNKDSILSKLSMHLCPSLLVEQLAKLSGLRNIWVSFLKEWDRPQIEQEISLIKADFNLGILRQGQIFLL